MLAQRVDIRSEEMTAGKEKNEHSTNISLSSAIMDIGNERKAYENNRTNIDVHVFMYTKTRIKNLSTHKYLNFWSAVRHARIRSLASSGILGALVSLAEGNSTCLHKCTCSNEQVEMRVK